MDDDTNERLRNQVLFGIYATVKEMAEVAPAVLVGLAVIFAAVVAFIVFI